MKPIVHLYTVCWNEADMLGFFFRHYDPWVDRYVIYDDGSTDGSREILQAHPKVELRRFARVETESFVLSHKAMQDEAWKESRGVADWIVVTAIDEHLHVSGQGTADYLAKQAARGVTMIPALGFDMNHPIMPNDQGLLVERVTAGRPRAAFNKLSIFRPLSLRETGFGPGRHAAEPVGDLRLPARDRMMLWHYKHLGFERNATREAEQALRLGKVDREQGFGQHYLWSKTRLRDFWDEIEREAQDLARPDFDPQAACAKPLWWLERPGIVRIAGKTWHAPPAQPRQDPTVSVLIKAYNHAPYVRQTIESVLAQEGPDFEIVVTDDGSTDGTLEIIRSFTDPRIRLEALPHNSGISTAMNATVSRARGRYLAILNSDDWALPGRLARQTDFLDRNPGISLVFGLPLAVDEVGEPTPPFNDFRAPFAWPDYSRRTWLRQFFFNGNCLCAPTAMIRREAYEAAGPYDLRLTNLQDLDMWIRMLIRGHEICLLPQELTAFRIRANNANMSAPRLDTSLRSNFETTHILQHFAAMSEELFGEIFREDDLKIVSADAPVALRVADLAAHIPSVCHQNFALGQFREFAQDIDAQIRLRELSGSLDALNVHAVQLRDARIALLETGLTALNADLNLRDRHILELQDLLIARERTIGEALASQERIRKSLSWRSTAILRWAGRTAWRLMLLR